ncbi:hypothetical protein N658DRAFT_183866 [Parathielavia hyrcaniae]|uniref:Uncharacterized protein n=1 Tax=Parathielavia hyrcaniae TaxID=113614 RepID=A0AAN6Q6R7_9PEZI|nr:hypothetical protein N658DRAFT_183866 [Parathielavia hyrcaniae]
MNNTMRIEQMLNTILPRDGYSALPAAIPSSSHERPASTSTSPTYDHKYCNLGTAGASNSTSLPQADQYSNLGTTSASNSTNPAYARKFPSLGASSSNSTASPFTHNNSIAGAAASSSATPICARRYSNAGPPVGTFNSTVPTYAYTSPNSKASASNSISPTSAQKHPNSGPPTFHSTTPAYAHKYSNSGASTSSFASSANTHNSSSHSRNPSYSTTYSIPETPPSAHSITGQFPSYCSIDSFDSQNKMADMADPADEDSKRSLAQYVDDEEHNSPAVARRSSRIAINRPIDLTGDDRADSPTDAVMPMMRRLPAGLGGVGAESSSPLQAAASSSPLNLARHAQHSPSSSIHHGAASTSGRSAGPSRSSDDDKSQAQDRIFPNVAQNNDAPLRLDQVLITSAVPRLYQTVEILMEECDFTLPKSCKFMEDCLMTKDLDPAAVNWRKSMSHIFGRNKNCTRSIPDHVWMWVCRKHYQRARYRNTHEFNKKLIRMVELQILRLEAWSNFNKDRGLHQEGVVVDWTLEVRRREKLRIQEHRKRKVEDEEDEEEGEDGEDLGPLATDGVLVPQWLLDETGSGKSTAEIQGIVARICHELDSMTLMAFPDIEILPNIVGERVKPKSNRARPAPVPVRRKQPQPAPRTPSNNKRQRRVENDYDDEPAQRPTRLPFRPHPQGPASVPFENDRFAYGNQPAAMPGAWPARFPNSSPRGGYPDPRAGGSHQRAFSMDSNAYNQPPMGFQAGYPEPANGFSGYVQAQNALPGRDYMRDPAYVAANLGQNMYWDANYHRQQQQQQAQQAQQQPAYPQNDFMRPPVAGASPQGGPPPVGAAKHSRHLSSPPRLRPTMGGHGGDGFAHQDARFESDSPYGAAQAAAPAANMYGTPGPARTSLFNGLPAPNSTYMNDGYYPSPPARLPQAPHGGAPPPADSYETYPPSRR